MRVTESFQDENERMRPSDWIDLKRWVKEWEEKLVKNESN